MPKHKPQIHTLSQIIGRMMEYKQDVGPWYEVMDVEIPGLANAIKSDPDSIGEIVWSYARSHSSDKYRVTWPDHVTVKKFNSDATYQPV
jgi:hypothetical protein